MNPVEYLIAGCMLVMAIGAWVLINALRNADDAFENELGFQLGIAPPVKSLETLPSFVPATSPRAIMPVVAASKPRRPPSSKPPMLPVGMTVADLDARQTGAPWALQKPVESNPPVSSESQATTPATPPRSPDFPAKQ
jgi:hypothetical protein